MFAVMRSPVLMEDEGRHFLEFTCETREEAEAWLDKECPKDKWTYFKRGDFYITQTVK